MPIQDDLNPNPIYGSDLHRIEEVEQLEAPSFSETMGAWWETENWIGSGLARETKPADGFKKDWHPILEDNKGYEDDLDRLIAAENPEQLDWIKNEIDRERGNREVIANSGFGTNLAAGLLTGIVDPINFIPIAGAASKFYTGGKFLKGAATVGAIGAATQTADELLLHSTQELRTTEESIFNVGGATILTGVLGGAASKLSKNRFDEISNIVEEEIQQTHRSAGSAGVTDFDPVKDIMSGKSTKAQEELIKAGGIEKLNFTPAQRLANNKESVNANRLIERLVELPFYKNKHLEGVAADNNVVTLMKLWEGPTTEAEVALKKAFKSYSNRVKMDENLERLTEAQFRERVAMSMRRGDIDSLDEVSAAARAYRDKIYNPLLRDAQKYGLLPEDVMLNTAESYLTRRWNVQKILADRTNFQDKVENWIKQNNTDLEWEDVVKVADQVTANITQSPLGVMRFGDDVIATAGEFKLRSFQIPDELIEEFLDNDIVSLTRNYVRSVTPEIEMSRNGLSRDLVPEMKAIQKEYDELIEAVEDNKKLTAAEKTKQITKYNEKLNATLADVRFIRDKLYGTYNKWDDPTGVAAKAHKALKQQALLSMLGQMTVSAMSDSANIIIQNGIKPFAKSLFKTIKGAGLSELSKKEVMKFGVGLDMYRSGRIRAFADLDEFDGAGKFFEMQDTVVDKFGKITLMDYWNSFHKQFTGVLSMDLVIDNSQKLVKGTLGKTQMTKLARAGIDKDLAERITKQYKKFGKKEDGFNIPNISHWDDAEAATAFKVSILKSVDWTINTPSEGLLPKLFSNKLGSLMMQFKSFMFAAHQQTLIPALQIRDRAALSGVLFSTFLGGLAMESKNILSGRQSPDTPQEWLVEAVDQAGPLAIVMEVNNMSDKIGGPSLQRMVGGGGARRFASRSAEQAILGPSIGMVKKTAESGLNVFEHLMNKATSGELGDEMDRNDIKNLRSLIWLQNLPVLRQSMDAVEEGFSDVLDLEGKRRPFTRFKENIEGKFDE